ncbi:hypothetical protein GCM10023260_16010 [Bartonella acomydis]|uniref:Uncharacterized protein n=1 Tax=Bartonella acomydis TaxID=686234 RepID=A0ABP9MWC9_9HYPH
MQKGFDGKLHVFFNGLYLTKGAVGYALQHAENKNKSTLFYCVPSSVFRQADFAISELLVADYQKFL